MLPALRLAEPPERMQAQDDAVPPPREGLRRKRFSPKTGTVMEGPEVGWQDWRLAMFLMTMSLKSVSSMKLQRDHGVIQKTASFLATGCAPSCLKATACSLVRSRWTKPMWAPSVAT